MAIVTIKNIDGTELHKVQLPRGHDGFTDADLSDLDLRRADLYGASMTRVNLRHSRLDGARLVRARLADAVLTGASFVEANMDGAYLRGANMAGVNLRGATLTYADLSCALLESADMRGANVENTLLSSTNLTSADLEGAVLGHNFIVVGPRPVLSLGPIGSRGDTVLFFRTNKGIVVRAGCYTGTLAYFKRKLTETYPASAARVWRHRADYLAACRLATRMLKEGFHDT